MTSLEVTPIQAHGSRILVVDDEPGIRAFIGRALNAAGCQTEFAATGNEALEQALTSHYDLIILDLVMPHMSGQDVLDRLIAARPDQAVLVLSCLDDVASKVDCLERGAQDYLTKPFSLAELLARVRVRLRGEAMLHSAGLHGAELHSAGLHGLPGAGPPAAGPPAAGPPAAGMHAAGLPAAAMHAGSAQAGPEYIKAGCLTLDVGRLVADVGQGPVPLTRLEFLLLRELAEHVGHSVPKGKLLATVWGYDFDPGSNVVDVCVRRLRGKLGFALIKTVRGEGYQLTGN
jgi:two-component system, OmpR family, response regulator